MNRRSTLLWGFVGTIVLTTIMSASQGLGLTRMNLPFMLGTMFTSNRDRATVYGYIFHLINGWVLASIYALAFESWRRATWWLGALIGFVHASFALTAVMASLPVFHPRMATEDRGPTPTQMLEPPGLLALHYGRQTPISTYIAHLIYGGILGAFYRRESAANDRSSLAASIAR